MRIFKMPAVLFAALFLTLASAANAQVSFGIRIGPPPRPRVVRVEPARPGRDYVWVAGYWYPVHNRYVWHQGYWTRPPYVGARWVQPRYEGRRYFSGYWEGGRGRISHDHRSDRTQRRDYGPPDRRSRRG